MLSDLRYRLRALFRRDAVESELDEELRFHMEQQAEKYRRAGASAEEALRRVRLEFGGPQQIGEECRDARGTRLLEDCLQDLRYAVRMMRKAPVFAVTAVATIALGIGASAAMFSVIDAVLLRPLPYRNPDRLVLTNTLVSNADFRDLRGATSTAFEDLAAFMVYRAIVPREDGAADRISKGQVTTNFLRLLGARIAFGRDFAEADGKPPAKLTPVFPPPQGAVAILSYEYFERRYGGNPAVLGREMPGAGGQPGPRIVGVVAPGFKLILPAHYNTETSPDIWIANDRGYDAANRGALMLRVIGVLRKGVTLDRAQAQVDGVAGQWGMPGFRVGLQLWRHTLVTEVRPALLALMGAVIFLLLIASANVANLILVRTSLRERELGVRAALGAGWSRLARQLVAEAALLAAVGTVAGTGLAWLGLRELLRFVPASVPRFESIGIDWRVILFAALAGLIECAVFALAPGLRAVRPDVIHVLRNAGRTAALAGGRLLRNAVVVAEVSLAFVLLIGSGLMLRSFIELLRVDPGYDPHGLLTFLLVGDARGFQQPERRLAFLREIEAQLRAIPGVESAGASLSLPLAGRPFSSGIRWGAEHTPSDANWSADVSTVWPGYFETLRTALIAGRTFTQADNAPDRNVAVIDESLAVKAFPQQSAIGKRIFVKMPNPLWLEVVGVVKHQRQASLAEPGLEQIYLTDGFFGIGVSRHWALRTQGDPAKLAGVIRADVARLAPGRMAVTQVETMDTTIGRAQAGTRFQLLLMGIFAVIAALLACVGLYGVLSSAVRQRTAEIGVRMALGATSGSILKLVAGQGLALSAAGVAIGLGISFGLTRGMASMLVGVKANDPLTYAAMTTLFLLITGIASWLPARRAACLDAATTLREE